MSRRKEKAGNKMLKREVSTKEVFKSDAQETTGFGGELISLDFKRKGGE